MIFHILDKSVLFLIEPEKAKSFLKSVIYPALENCQLFAADAIAVK